MLQDDNENPHVPILEYWSMSPNCPPPKNEKFVKRDDETSTLYTVCGMFKYVTYSKRPLTKKIYIITWLT